MIIKKILIGFWRNGIADQKKSPVKPDPSRMQTPVYSTFFWPQDG